VYVFPEDFIYPDGEYRSHVGNRLSPVIYFMRDGSRTCAHCINTSSQNPQTTTDAQWKIARIEVNEKGQNVRCDKCQTIFDTLYC
jgi:hypothetical protein